MRTCLAVGEFLYEYDWFEAFPEALTLVNCGQALRTYRRLHALAEIE